MQNYNQQPQGYQRPGSAASFAGQAGAPPPPPYGGNQGYQSAAPNSTSQWAPPPQPTQHVGGQQWNPSPQTSQPQNNWGGQSQQGSGGYNPSVYGAMPGAYQNPSTGQPQYQTQHQDIPPPPPPKPQAFIQQNQQANTQNWSQQPAYGVQQGQQNYQAQQQSTGFTPQGQSQQAGYQQQGGLQDQVPSQQPYNTAAPPPPSQTPGGSYFPPAQQGGRPGSIYGADQTQGFSSPTTQQTPNTVFSPNEQQPAYIPPSLTGQGVQSYMPVNTNPQAGVYIPPPPDIPAWQQATHAPLQGGQKKFRYTKPSVDPSLQSQQSQGYQQQMGTGQPMQQGQFNQQPFQQQQQFAQPAQNQFQPHHQHQGSMEAGQFVQPQQPLTQQFVHPEPHQNQFQQPQQPQGFVQQPQVQQQPNQQFPQQGQQWQPTPPSDQAYVHQQPNIPAPYGVQQLVQQQQQWQPGHHAQASIAGQQFAYDQGIQAPKPISGHTGTTPPGFVHDASPHSQPVSPVQNRHSMSFSPGHPANLGRTGSVSSIAMGALRNQHAESIKTSSPAPSVKAVAPAPATVPTSPPALGDPSAFSALGSGGPSDWEHFGAIDEEIDDEELFVGKKEDTKNEPAELGAELPAGPTPPPPPPADEWPTPPAQHAPLNVGIQRRDTFQPTPPPPHSTGTPSQQPSRPPPAQQTFVMGDEIVSTQTSPRVPTSLPPPTHQSFVMNDGSGWVAPKQGTPAQQQPHAPPPQSFPPQTSNAIIMDDGGWTSQAATTQSRNQTPIQQPHAPPLAGTPLIMGDTGAWGAPQQPPAQVQGAWDARPQANNDVRVAELKAKDDAYESLKTNAEKEKADLRAEMEKLKTGLESAKSHAASEKTVLNEQIESMKAAAAQAKTNVDALIKEKDSTIEMHKEDMEGKDEVIKERDATIADLRRQLDAEKSRELPKPTPADLVPDIDPWYAGSLERYISMLRSEATEPQVEDKIKTFQSFLKAESGIRGLEYYSSPPPAPVAQEPVVSPPHSEVSLSRGVSNASTRKQDIQVQIPQHRVSPDEEPLAYSPGGRPLIQRRPTLQTLESIGSEQSFMMSSRPEQPPPLKTTSEKRASGEPILTPTSSNDDDFNKTPIQSPPEEQQQPQYKAYVPPAGAPTTATTQATHRQSMSFGSITPIQPLNTSKGKSDEIFFGEPRPQPASKPTSRPTTSTSTLGDVPVPVPAPLSFTSQSTATPSPGKNPLDTLSDLLPTQIAPTQPNPRLGEIKKQAQALPSDFTYITELTRKWEKQAAQNRAKLDRERHKRQQESEARTDELFNDNEISYADIGQIEDEFKEKERDLKAQEDREEYKSYVEEVFDRVYDGLQGDIKHLMESYIEVEALLHSSVSGIQSFSSPDIPSTKDSLDTLRDLRTVLEVRYDKVVSAVAERDKRYKKTELQPLYARGDIKKMKSVEKHFENAEKQAIVRAKGEKAERVGELVRMAEEVVVRAVGVEQGDLDKILAAMRALASPAEDNGQREVVGRAGGTLLALKASSKALLGIFNNLEIELNTAVLEAEIAQARASGTPPEKIAEFEREMKDGEKKLVDEYLRRVKVLEQDQGEIDALVQEKGGVVSVGAGKVLSEEEERQVRIRKALEEAKRRNGEL
ncbi:hypothetical protein BDV96DRAFT_550736 [Lophiotrema nucula]|uniref:Uncharacterized protein n=1 Tax=Lophiotrema nucula TaxID=690887 RepID=A0A6A5Z050_9PLEO|nr:hypothetical protein BDV96DRAFT_550736 [Lophiotrema nucula]